jgi:Calcium binding
MTAEGREQPANRSTRQRLAKRRLDELVEEAIVDAYGESEQRVGLLSMIQMKLKCPFMIEILGTQARVERVDTNDANEIVAVCRYGRERQTIPILDLPLPSPSPVGWEWIEAYRHWARGGR